MPPCLTVIIVGGRASLAIKLQFSYLADITPFGKVKNKKPHTKPKKAVTFFTLFDGGDNSTESESIKSYKKPHV